MRPAATRSSLRAPPGPERQHVAVLGQQHAVGGQPRARGQPRVLGQHPVLAVDGHEVARPHALQQLHQLVLRCRGRRRGRARVPRCTTSQPRRKRLPITPRDRALVAGDGPRGEHDGVAGPDGELAVLVHADQRQRGEAARPGCPPRTRPRGPRGVGRGCSPRAARAGGDAQQAEVRGHLGVVHHAAAEEGDGAPAPRAPGPPRAGCGGSRWRSRTRARGRACARRPPRRRGRTSSSPPVRPRRSTFVLSESSASTPRSPQADSASRSVRSSGGAVGSILKSPLATTTPAGVSMARARLSSTLWATRMGWTRKGPSSTGCPGRAGAGPPSRRARAAGCARSRGSGGCRRRAPARPAARTRARRCGPRGRGSGGCREHARAARPGTGSRGRWSPRPAARRSGTCTPASTSSRWSSHSSTIAFRPNSPSPPRGTSRSGRSSIASSSDDALSSDEPFPAPSERSGVARALASCANSTTDSVSARLEPSILSNLKCSLRLG